MMMMKNNDDPKNREIAYDQILACKTGGRYGGARVIYS